MKFKSSQNAFFFLLCLFLSVGGACFALVIGKFE